MGDSFNTLPELYFYMANQAPQIADRRRKLLKAIGTGAVVTGFGAGNGSATEDCAVPDEEKWADEVPYVWKHDRTDFHEAESHDGYHKLGQEIRGSLIYYGCEYGENNENCERNGFGKWEHAFTSAAYVTSQRKPVGGSNDEYENYGNTYGQMLTLENLEPDYGNLVPPAEPRMVGGYPPEDTPTDGTPYDDTAFTVFGILMSAANPVLGASATAASLVFSLANEGRGDDDPYKHNYSWTYGGADTPPCEATHFADSVFMSAEGKSKAHIRAESTAAQTEGAGDITVDFTVTVDADPSDPPDCPPGEPCPTENRPEPGTEEYIEYLEEADFAEEIDPAQSFRTLCGGGTPSGRVFRSKQPSVIYHGP